MTDDPVRRHALLLSWAVTIPLLLLLLLLVALVVSNAMSGRGGEVVPFMLIYYTPALFYLAAMFMVRSALRRIAAGDLFADVLPSLLSRSGCALLVGALFKEIGVPLLTWQVLGEAYVRPFEPSAVTLGVVGALLLLVGKLFERAAAARKELEQFV